MTSTFNGFPKKGIEFLSSLEQNNNREWFTAHKAEYEELLFQPAQAMVVSLGERLRQIAPDIQAIPKVDKSIFRLYRDTRFSKDKRPYKTHLAMFMWEGDGPKMESPGFYLHLEKDKLLIAGGMHSFTKDQLPVYRAAVDDDTSGKALVNILRAGEKAFPARDNMGIEDYKRVPRGFPQDHPRAELLKKKGVTFAEQGPLPASLFTPRAADYIYKRFEKMAPLHNWLKGMIRA